MRQVQLCGNLAQEQSQAKEIKEPVNSENNI